MMPRRVLSISLVEPQDRGPVERFLEKYRTYQDAIDAMNQELAADSCSIINDLAMRHNVPKDVYIDTSRFPGHGLLFFESIAFVDPGPAKSQSPQRVVN